MPDSNVENTPQINRQRIKLIIVDDHEHFRKSLVSFIKGHRIFEIIGEAQDGMEAIELVTSILPELILMDLNMPRLNGLKAARDIKKNYPKIKIILYTMFDHHEINKDDLNIVDAFIPKHRLFEDLINTIEDMWI